MRIVVSSSDVVSDAPSSSHSSPAPAWGPSHGRQSSMNFSNMSPSHRLQFLVNCSSVGPPQGHKCCHQTCSNVGSIHGSTGPARSLLQCGLPMGVTCLRAPTCSGVGSPTGCGWVSAPPFTSVGAGHSCLTVGCSTGCGGISALVPGAPPPPPSSLTLVSAELFLSHILTSLSSDCCWCCTGFSPLFLNMFSQRCYQHC